MTTPSEFDRHLLAVEELVHDTIHDPLRWNGVLSHVVSVLGGSGASLAVRSKLSHEVVDPVGATWSEEVGVEYLTRFRALDPVAPQLVTVPTGPAFIVEELLDMRSYRRSPFFNEFADKHDVSLLVGTTFNIDERYIGSLAFYRATASPGFDRVERAFIERVTAPIRFALSHRRLSKELSMAHGVLDRLALGVVQLDERGGIAWCNERAEEILRRNDNLTVRKNRLRARPEKIDKQLNAAIHTVLHGESRPRGEQLVIPRRFERAPLHLVAVPLSRQYCASQWDDYVPATIFINDLREEDYLVDIVGMFQQVFKLTDIQTEIVSGMLKGKTNKELATDGRNQESIRTHIKAIYHKTGVNSRTALQKLAHQMTMQLRPRSGR